MSWSPWDPRACKESNPKMGPLILIDEGFGGMGKGRGGESVISTLWIILLVSDNDICRFGVLEVLI